MISVLMPTYNRADLAFSYGKGAWLYTADGQAFLDFGAGVATSSLGHAHPELVKTIQKQAGDVIHVSNLYRIPQAERLAELLVQNSFAESVFFCNSGAEANEGMVKTIRRAQAFHGHPERTDIICFHGAFHGRTLAMLSATGNSKYLEGFGTPAPGFIHVPLNDIHVPLNDIHVPLNDIEAVRTAITPRTAGIMLEPIQGESGIKAAQPAFLQALRHVCDTHGLYLGIDEIQTGMGRTGRLFAHEWAEISPDIATTAKGIAGGVPLGAILAKQHLAQAMTAGSHGSTFGGNPLACAAGYTVVSLLLGDGFFKNVEQQGLYLHKELTALVADYPHIFQDVRGKGLLLGLKCIPPVLDVQKAVLEQHMLTVTAGDNVLRIIPPLIISEEESKHAIQRLRKAADTLQSALSFSDTGSPS